MKQRPRIGSVRLGRLAVTLGIVIVVNLVIFWVGASSYSMRIEGTSRGVSSAPVALVTALPFVLVGLLAWELDRFFAWARPAFGWCGLIFAILSAALPLLLLANLAAGAVLALLHLVTGLGWAVALRPWRSETELISK